MSSPTNAASGLRAPSPDTPTSSAKFAAMPSKYGSTTDRKKNHLGLIADVGPIVNNENHENPIHQWIPHAKMKEVANEHGIDVRSGRFSKTEDERLVQAVNRFLEDRQLSEADVQDLILRRGRNPINLDDRDRRDFWPSIASNFPDRPMMAIYNRVRRLFPEFERKGAWTDEETKHLLSLVAQFGRDWRKIGQELCRLPENCRSRHKMLRNDYRMANGLDNAPRRVRWVIEDVREFICCVLEYALRSMERAPGMQPQTLTVAELLLLIEKKGLSWIAISEIYHRRPIVVSRNENFLRTKWNNIVPIIRRNLEEAMKEDGLALEHVITFEDVVLLGTSPTYHRAWTREDDMALIQGLIQKFPNAQIEQDVIWTQIAQGELVKYGANRVNQRFRHMVKSANLDPMQQLSHLCLLLLEFISGLTDAEHRTLIRKQPRRRNIPAKSLQDHASDLDTLSQSGNDTDKHTIATITPTKLSEEFVPESDDDEEEAEDSGDFDFDFEVEDVVMSQGSISLAEPETPVVKKKSKSSRSSKKKQLNRSSSNRPSKKSRCAE